MSKKSKKRVAAQRAAAQQVAAKRAAAAKLAKKRPPLTREKKVSITLIAAICLFAILLSVSSSILIARKAGSIPYATAYDKIKNMDDYMTLAESFYKNTTFDASSLEQITYSEEDMDDYVSYYLPYVHRESKAEAQRETVIGLGDDITFYVTALKLDGVRVLPYDLCGTSYSAGVMTVGSSKIPESVKDMASSAGVYISGFGADFDDRLIAMGLKPSDTARETRANGSFDTDAVLIVSYTITKGAVNESATDPDKRYTWESKSYASFTSARLDLGAESDALAEELVKVFHDTESPVTYGEQFEVILENYTLPADLTVNEQDNSIYKKPQVYKYTVVVEAVVEESPVSVEFTVPSDYFSETTDGKTYAALNGKTLTMDIIITSVDDNELATVNAAFLKDTLKFETNETDDSAAIADYKAKMMVTFNEDAAESYRNSAINLILDDLVYNNKAKYTYEYPQDVYSTAYEAVLNDLKNSYYSTYGSEAQTDDQLNYFAYQMSNGQVQTYNDYCYNMALAEIYRNMVVFTIFNEQKLSVSVEEIEAGYRERIDALVEAYDNEHYTEDYFVGLYGKNAIYSQVREDLIWEKVGEWLLANNTLQKTPAKS